MTAKVVSYTNQSVPPSRPPVKLWTGRFIMIITFLAGFPAGMALAFINWQRMGRTGKARTHLIATCAGGLLLIIFLLLLPSEVARRVAFTVTLTTMFYLNGQMTADIKEFKATHTEGSRKKAHWFSGCLIGLSALLLFLALSFIIHFFLLFIGLPVNSISPEALT